MKSNGLFTGKKVVLIGPAPHITEKFQDFSDYDLVCRINLQVHMPDVLKKYTGDRIDVWFPTDKMIRDNHSWAEYDHVKIVRVGESRKRYFTKDTRHKFSRMNGFLSQVRREIKCEPNRGMKAIIDICMDRPSELYITGFTFYQKDVAYYDNYCPASGQQRISKSKGDVANHRQRPQIKYFIENILPLKFVRIDQELRDVVDQFDS